MAVEVSPPDSNSPHPTSIQHFSVLPMVGQPIPDTSFSAKNRATKWWFTPPSWGTLGLVTSIFPRICRTRLLYTSAPTCLYTVGASGDSFCSFDRNLSGLRILDAAMAVGRALHFAVIPATSPEPGIGAGSVVGAGAGGPVRFRFLLMGPRSSHQGRSSSVRGPSGVGVPGTGVGSPGGDSAFAVGAVHCELSAARPPSSNRAAVMVRVIRLIGVPRSMVIFFFYIWELDTWFVSK